MAGTAVRGRLTWQTATVGPVTDETPTVRTLRLEVPDWPGHRAGQHVDIHCVTKWSKLDTTWTGVAIDTLLDGVETDAQFALAFCDGGYTTNVPLRDLRGGQAWIAYEYAGEPLEPEHGGPARLLIPHLYFWKSAKWVRGLQLRSEDEPGFWESVGYHNYGDPWREQRYWGD